MSTLQIAVLERGFVYVGECESSEKSLTIKNARNIRRWGTERGLGELALEGPKANTRLDRTGDIFVPIGSVVHVIDCNAAAWEGK